MKIRSFNQALLAFVLTLSILSAAHAASDEATSFMPGSGKSTPGKPGPVIPPEPEPPKPEPPAPPPVAGNQALDAVRYAKHFIGNPAAPAYLFSKKMKHRVGPDFTPSSFVLWVLYKKGKATKADFSEHRDYNWFTGRFETYQRPLDSDSPGDVVIWFGEGNTTRAGISTGTGIVIGVDNIDQDNLEKLVYEWHYRKELPGMIDEIPLAGITVKFRFNVFK